MDEGSDLLHERWSGGEGGHEGIGQSVRRGTKKRWVTRVGVR